MRKYPVALAVLLSCACVLITTIMAKSIQASDSPEPQRIVLTPETGPVMTFKETGHCFAPATERPKAVKTAPDARVGYYVFPWCGGEAIIAVSKSQLWADRDGDGDLLEEEAIPITRNEDGDCCVTFKLDLRFKGTAIPAEIRMWEHMKDDGSRYSDHVKDMATWDYCQNPREMSLTNRTRMSGTVRLGEKKMKVSLTDYMVNGRYDDYYTTATEPYWLSDHIHLDVNGDGRYKKAVPPWGEDYSLARGFVIDGQGYTLEVLEGGTSLTWQPVKVSFSSIKYDADVCDLELISDTYGAYDITGKKGVAVVPTGLYELNGYSYRLDGYEIEGRYSFDGARRPKISIAEKFDLKFREDHTYTLTIKRDQAGKGYKLSSICHGPYGESIEIIPKGKINGLAPLITVYTLDGIEIASLQTTYG